MNKISDPQALDARELNKPFSSIDFNFTLHKARAGVPDSEVERQRASA